MAICHIHSYPNADLKGVGHETAAIEFAYWNTGPNDRTANLVSYPTRLAVS